MKKLLTLFIIILSINSYSQELIYQHFKPLYLSNKTIETDNIIHVYLVRYDSRRDAHIAYIDSGSNVWYYVIDDINKLVPRESRWIFSSLFKSKDWDLVGQPKPTYFQSPMQLIKYMNEHGYKFKEIISYIEKTVGEDWWTAWVFEKIN